MTLITAHAHKQVLYTFEAHVQLHIYSNEHSPAAGGHQKCNIITRTHEDVCWISQDGLLLNEHALPTVNRRDSHNYSVFHSDKFLTLINKNSLWPSAQETVLQRHISCNSLEKQMIDR